MRGRGWTRKRGISLLLLIVFIPQATGCGSWHEEELTPEEYADALADDPPRDRIVGATLTTGEDFSFHRFPPAVLERDSLFGQLESGLQFSAPVSNVERVWVQWRDSHPGRTILAVVGVGVVVFLVVAAIADATSEPEPTTTQSCPLVYSWDGERWVLDAEPYGGATSKGLERTDFPVLEHLAAVDGEYRLLVTNEMNETQYTNMFELWAVHHPAGTRVVADEFGGLYTVRNPVPPSSATDATGEDLLPWLEASDRRIWEHEPVRTATGDLREEIVLAFPKPEGAQRARLIADVATGAWGSRMIKELYEMRGTGLEAFHQTIDSSPLARQGLFAWNVREELYTLKIAVEEPTGWEVRGLLVGGGPLVAEQRAVPLEIGRAEGDELRVRIRPPVGFWALNSFRVDYGADEPPEVVKLAPVLARTSEGEDVLPQLTAVDDAYYAMPEKGDQAELRFPAVEAPDGMEQTLILHSRGFYRLHITADHPPDLAALAEIEAVPDAAVRRAVESFAAAAASVSGEVGEGEEGRR